MLRNAIQSQLHLAGYVPFMEYALMVASSPGLPDEASYTRGCLEDALHRKVPTKELQTLMG